MTLEEEDTCRRQRAHALHLSTFTARSGFSGAFIQTTLYEKSDESRYGLQNIHKGPVT